VIATLDTSLKVPIYGAAESLNLATAAAVCLYASAKAMQRKG
jgi:TrmH family RNA methyltransferase